MDRLDELRALVEINSTYMKEQKIALYLEARLKACGFSTTRVEVSPGWFNIVGERGSVGEPILFYGHMDTVPVCEGWKHDPFSISAEGDKLYGLGASDMKAGVASIIQACQNTRNSSRRLKVAFAVDEEYDSRGGWAIANSGFFDNCKFAIVPEISDSPKPGWRANELMLGRRGRAVYEFRVYGKSAHGAHIHDGISAISEASRLTLALERMNSHFKADGILPSQSQFVRLIKGENSSLSLPEEAIIELDRHIVAPHTTQGVFEELKAALKSLYKSGELKNSAKPAEVSIKKRATPYLEPFLTDKENKYAKLLASIVNDEVAKPNYTYGLSTADECILAKRGVSTIGYGPHGESYHGADEWVSKKSYDDICNVLEQFIKQVQ